MTERTLTDADVDAIAAKVAERLQRTRREETPDEHVDARPEDIERIAARRRRMGRGRRAA